MAKISLCRIIENTGYCSCRFYVCFYLTEALWNIIESVEKWSEAPLCYSVHTEFLAQFFPDPMNAFPWKEILLVDCWVTVAYTLMTVCWD